MYNNSGGTGERGRLLPAGDSRKYGTTSTSDERSAVETGEMRNRGSVSPLPLKQLSLIFAMRLPESIAYNQVIPYINNMMTDIGVVNGASQAGYYSGIIESSFAVAELLTVLGWGRLSDRIGRKPVLICGLFGSMLSTLLFGFSKSFTWALITRSLSGALSGNSPVCHSAIGDMTDETNQAHAFTIIGLAVNIAQITGFSMGGVFAKPARTFPGTFGKYRILQEFPYLLPCIMSGLINMASCSLGVLFFRETLPRKADSRRRGGDNLQPTQKKQSILRIARSPEMFSVLAAFFLLSVLNNAFVVVFALFAYTPVKTGGLGLSITETGWAISASGLAGAFIQVIILPFLQRRCNTVPLYLRLMSIYPLLYVSFPLLNLLASLSPGQGPVIWLFVGLVLVGSRLASMSYSLNLILTKNAAPSASMLGLVFGISQVVSCLARSVAPAFVSVLFALSKEHRLLSGNFVWYVMFLISLIGVWAASNVRDGAISRRHL